MPLSPSITVLGWLLVLNTLALSSCCSCSRSPQAGDTPPAQNLWVSVADQKMQTYENGKAKRRYTISTSRFGVGDRRYSNCTPLGRLQVVEIIGEGLPKGMRLSSRQPTGEIVKKNTPHYDPIVTRIVRLRGLEPCNAGAYKRCIYIHGTPNEKELGKPVSWGCVRMASSDIVRLCKWVRPGAEVNVTLDPLPPRKCCTIATRWFAGSCKSTPAIDAAATSQIGASANSTTAVNGSPAGAARPPTSAQRSRAPQRS